MRNPRRIPTCVTLEELAVHIPDFVIMEEWQVGPVIDYFMAKAYPHGNSVLRDISFCLHDKRQNNGQVRLQANTIEESLFKRLIEFLK